MAARKYSVAEIDQMRSFLYSRETAGPPGDSWDDDDVKNRVEDLLRTYMLNGTDPAELEQSAKDAEALYEAEWRGFQRTGTGPSA